MKQKIYICTNDEQLLCAKLAKFIIEKVNTHPINSIEIVHNRSFPVLKELSNQEYLRKGKREIYSPNDMQSFTFLRFAIPELMSFDGQALVIDPDSLPDSLIITARTVDSDDQSEIMGVRHKDYKLFGVQFHPESILTESGHKLLENFINV